MADIHGGTDKQRREMVLETIDELISKGVIDYPHKQGSLSADKSQEEKSKARSAEAEKPKFARIISSPEISEQHQQKSMEIKSSQKTAAPKTKMILEVYESQEQSFKARASEIENQKQKTKEPVTIPASVPKKEKIKERKQADIHKSKDRDIEIER